MAEVRWLKIGDICSIEKGVTGLLAATPGKYPLVATGAERRSAEDFQFDTKAVCIPLVSSTGHGKKSLNHVHYQEGKFALGTILAAVIPKDEKTLDARYLHTYLKMNKDRVLVPLMKGAANVSLSVSAISNINIPVPSISEQKKALAKLDSMSNEHAELIQETERQLELLKRLRQQILEEAIEGKLTVDWRKNNPSLITGANHASQLLDRIQSERFRLIQQGILKREIPLPPITGTEKPFPLPTGWTWCRLTSLLSHSKDALRRGPFGSSITKSMFVAQSKTSTKVYEQQNAIYKDWSLGDYYIELNEHPNLKSFIAGPGDVIISCAGTIGEAYLLPITAPMGVINQALLKLRINNSIAVTGYFLLYFKSLISAKINADAKGTAMKNIGSVKYLKNQLLFPLPPIIEQEIIIKKVAALQEMLSNLETQVSERKNQIEMLMRSVLLEAFETGMKGRGENR